MRRLIGGRVRAALFDIDGTLIDSNDLHAEAWRRTFAEFGHDIPFDRIRPQIGKGGDNLMPALLPPDVLAADEAEIESFRAELFEREYMDRIRPFPGVRDLFQRVRADGIDIVLASSGKEHEVAHHLELIGCGELVTAMTSADDVAHSKPAPDIFAAALAKLPGATPTEAVMVGDSPYDMQAAGTLGIATIGFRCGGFSDAALIKAGCGALYDGPEDLLRRFDASPFTAAR